MNHSDVPAYGLWSLVIINSLVFIIFAFSFAKPQSSSDWQSFGAFSAFLATLTFAMKPGLRRSFRNSECKCMSNTNRLFLKMDFTS